MPVIACICHPCFSSNSSALSMNIWMSCRTMPLLHNPCFLQYWFSSKNCCGVSRTDMRSVLHLPSVTILRFLLFIFLPSVYARVVMGFTHLLKTILPPTPNGHIPLEPYPPAPLSLSDNSSASTNSTSG